MVTKVVSPSVVIPPQDEIEKFYTVIRALGYSGPDFMIRVMQWSSSTRPAPTTGDLVIVTRKSNGIERAYPTVPCAAWLFSFFDDLNAGIFDLGVRSEPRCAATEPGYETEPQA